MQHDYIIDNQSGLNFRQDVNNVLLAIVSQNSGNAEPTTTYAYMPWVDTSGANPILKFRNAANSGWVVIGRVDLENFGLNGVTYGTAPSSPLPYQFWIDTSGANPILKFRNGANSAWISVGRADLAAWNLLSKEGGTMSAAIDFSNTDYTKLPAGTTAQRPASPSAAMIRFNTDLVAFEGHNGSAWAPIGGGGYVVTSVQSISASGTINTSTTDQRQMRHVQGNAASVTTSTTPFGTGGGWKDGTEVLLVGNDDTNSVIIPYNDAAKGCVGNFTSLEITKYTQALFVYSTSLDRWILR